MRPPRLRIVALSLLAGIAGSVGAQVPGQNNAITDVPGISVGHFTGADAGTTVVLAASATLFAGFYPILSAARLEGPQSFAHWMWLDSWR